LQELTVRIDCHPDNKAQCNKEYRKRLMVDSSPDLSLIKDGGGVMKLVQERSDIIGSWTGMTRGGVQVVWNTITMVWLAVV
jgi:hypothetical protein